MFWCLNFQFADYRVDIDEDFEVRLVVKDSWNNSSIFKQFASQNISHV
jgi:hypothetical protein